MTGPDNRKQAAKVADFTARGAVDGAVAGATPAPAAWVQNNQEQVIWDN